MLIIECLWSRLSVFTLSLHSFVFPLIICSSYEHICAHTFHPTLQLGCCGRASRNELLAVAVSAAVVVCWFAGRHSPWAWALQDVFAFCLCCSVLRVLRLPSAKVGIHLFGSPVFGSLCLSACFRQLASL